MVDNLNKNSQSFFKLCILMGITALSLGCPRNVIEGTVTDVKGNTLPGVIVAIEGGNAEAVTNALGRYKISYLPGDITLGFAKTGYTPGRLEVGNVTSNVEADVMTLWALPYNAGVYLFENYRYRNTASFEPKRFKTQNFGVIYGFRKTPEIEIQSNEPTLICYKMQRSGISCNRMDKKKIRPEGISDKEKPLEVFTKGRKISFEQVIMDKPQRRLVQLKFSEELEPGVYALHWGALSGYTTTDKRIFTFKVALPDVDEEPEDSTTEQGKDE